MSEPCAKFFWGLQTELNDYKIDINILQEYELYHSNDDRYEDRANSSDDEVEDYNWNNSLCIDCEYAPSTDYTDLCGYCEGFLEEERRNYGLY